MKAAICEDIAVEANLLKTKIEKLMPPACMLTDTDIFFSGTELLNCGNFYDIIFIDCKLPDMTGIELAQKIRENNNCSSIIFVTSYIEFAAEGYTVNALRYLMKPVSDKKLSEALLAFEKLSKADCILEVTGMHIPVFTKSSEIMYIESLGRKTLVRMNTRSVSSAKPLDMFEKELRNSCFFRTSRQFIVNMKYISHKEKDHLIMDNGEVVVISRRKLNDFNHQYAGYMRSCD